MFGAFECLECLVLTCLGRLDALIRTCLRCSDILNVVYITSYVENSDHNCGLNTPPLQQTLMASQKRPYKQL